jgi:hypothetical protein
MIERLIVLIAFGALAVLVYRLFRRLQVRHAVQLAPVDPLLAARRPGVPAILYFTSPTCVPCRTQQRPGVTRVEKLKHQLQSL